MSPVQHYLVVGDDEDEMEVVHGQECDVLVIDGDESYTDQQCHVGHFVSEEGIDCYFRHWWERPLMWDRYQPRIVVKPGRHAIRVGDNDDDYPAPHELYEDWIELGEEEQR